MLNPVFSLCVFLVEMVISYVFFSSVFKRRTSPGMSLLLGTMLFAMVSAVNILWQNNGVLNGLTTLLVNVLFAMLCFGANLYKSLFYSALLAIINVTMEIAVISFFSFFTGSEFVNYNDDLLLLFFQAVTIKALYFSILLILVKVLRPKESQYSIPVGFLLYPVVAAGCQTVFWYICAQPNMSYRIQFLLSAAGICLFSSSVFLFISYAHQLEKDKEAMAVKNELSRLQTEQSYYQILDQQNQQLRIYAHDAKKHLAAIRALSDDPQIERYVAALSENLANYTQHCRSGNKLLDVMIHKYSIDCDMRGIRLEYDVRECNLAQLDDIDLVAILGNLMDNAVAAAEKSAAKTIRLTTVHRNSFSVMILRNSCDTPPKQSGIRLLSTKPDSSLHGFGLKSAEKSIRKYQGDYEWRFDPEEKMFTVTVMVAD